ncbi:MAG: hypothetical protein M1829_002320 [Trizodia sp. TS-e1964]|nr:MAG: hypothetical protein M1829_002320 [Trizodia sp. TS-e1964]
MNSLFRRCVVCPQGNTPPCPPCAADETCSLSILTCTACPGTSCIKTDSSGATANNGPVQVKSDFNAGAIAGGVVGGVIAIGIFTYLVWRFCIKNRKQRYQEDDWVDEVSDEKTEQFHARRAARASTHTVGSIASTTLTRASNVIQIAYIPGVTNRESPSPSTPGVLVPPVPPLPNYGSHSNSGESTPDYSQDQHFFMPSDLRDSTYSGVSESRARGSYARTSLTPSVATTIYRHNAIVDPMPAQTVHLAKAAVVSVKSTGNSSPDESPAATPPVPSVNYQRHGGHRALGMREIAEEQPPPSPAFSVGSTFLNSTASTAMPVHARPVLVTKSSRNHLGAASLAPSSVSSASSTIRPDRPRISVASAVSTHSRAMRHTVDSTAFDELSTDEDEDPHARSRRSLMGRDRDSKVTVIEDTPAINQSPFRDPEPTPSPTPPVAPPPRSAARRSIDAIARHLPKIKSDRSSSGSNHSHKKSGSLSAVIEEATKRASKQPTHGGLGSTKRGASPFDDANVVQ